MAEESEKIQKSLEHALHDTSLTEEVDVRTQQQQEVKQELHKQTSQLERRVSQDKLEQISHQIDAIPTPQPSSVVDTSYTFSDSHETWSSVIRSIAQFITEILRSFGIANSAATVAATAVAPSVVDIPDSQTSVTETVDRHSTTKRKVEAGSRVQPTTAEDRSRAPRTDVTTARSSFKAVSSSARVEWDYDRTNMEKERVQKIIGDLPYLFTSWAWFVDNPSARGALHYNMMSSTEEGGMSLAATTGLQQQLGFFGFDVVLNDDWTRITSFRVAEGSYKSTIPIWLQSAIQPYVNRTLSHNVLKELDTAATTVARKHIEQDLLVKEIEKTPFEYCYYEAFPDHIPTTTGEPGGNTIGNLSETYFLKAGNVLLNTDGARTVITEVGILGSREVQSIPDGTGIKSHLATHKEFFDDTDQFRGVINGYIGHSLNADNLNGLYKGLKNLNGEAIKDTLA